MKKTGVFAGVMVVLVFLSVVFIGFIGSVANMQNCYQSPANIAGQLAVNNGEASVTETPLFTAFQDNPANEFSDAEKAEQRTNAAAIVRIGKSRPEQFSDRDIAIVIATAIQESNLINLPYQGDDNDNDSLGLFQMRPSMISYGTASEIMDINHSINVFYDRMSGVANREQTSMIEVAITIQIPSRSAYYSRWAWDDIATEVVGYYSSSSPDGSTDSGKVCTIDAEPVASGDAHLPAAEGYSISSGGGFNDSSYDGTKPHKGIDLSNYPGGSSGKAVYAALPGVVIASGIGNGCNGNNTVTILHDGGFETGYMHMNGSDITVRVGDHVSAGQQIGAIASCGDSTGAHLHFEVNIGTDGDEWINSIESVSKYGSTWVDPVAVMAHFGVSLVP